MRGLAGILLALIVLAASRAGAAEISDLEVELDGTSVLASFHLVDGLDDHLIERVQTGLPTTLVYDFELLRDRKRWFDRELVTSSLTVVGMYDAVRREYLINYKLDGRLMESRVVEDLAGLEDSMTRFERLPIFMLQPVKKSSPRFLIRARAAIGWKNFLGLIPTRVTTDWRESRKFRPPSVTY